MQRNESSKSNKRVVVIVIALILIFVLAFGGYTFAKYLSEKQVTANATVAKWGFVIDVKADGLFGTDYTSSDGQVAAIVEGGSGVAVKAASEVVAPGTKGEMEFSVTGQAEVLAKMSVDFGTTKDIALVVTVGETGSHTYNPIKYTLSYGTSEAYGQQLVTAGSLEKVKAAVEEKLNVASIAAGSEAVNHYFKLEWSWAFDNAAEVDGSGATGNDLDTVLGMYTAESVAAGTPFELNGKKFTVTAKGTQTQLVLDMTITVEQILQAA